MPTSPSTSAAIVLTPRRAGLCCGRDNTVEILVRIQAAEPAQAPADAVQVRPPQALALVIDRSGSMSGRPLEEAKRCAAYVLGRLRPTDFLSLVQFDNRVQCLWPAVPVGDGAAQRAAIAGITAGGNTNLHGGWKAGADTLQTLVSGGLKRVILLSDGQANEGLTEPDAIAAQCAALAAQGITTSTYGLGNSFNEDLMVAMARAGGGNHYYGDTADDLMEPFQQELELLGNLCLRDLRIQVSAPNATTVRLLNDFAAVDGGWRMLDMAWGAEAWAVFRVEVPAAAVATAGGTLPLLRVAVQGLGPDGAPVQLERVSLALPVLSPGAWAGLTDDELVTRRLSELSAAEALTAVRQAAADGNWPRVESLIAEASRQFAGNPWVAAMLQAMESIAKSRSRERMMKETRYSASRLHSRLSAKHESLEVRAIQDGIEIPSYLRRKASQGKGDL
mgnify:CR=1 FL=1